LALTWMLYFFWLALPVSILVVMLTSQGGMKVTFGGYSFLVRELSYVQRGLLSLMSSALILTLILFVRHFRELMRHFQQGEIFNSVAIVHARKALSFALILWSLSVVLDVAGYLYRNIVRVPALKVDGSRVAFELAFTVNLEFLFGLVFFGLMYLLLWSLEIGRDLNEESELTI